LRVAADLALSRSAKQWKCDRGYAIPGVGETVIVHGQERFVQLEGAGGRLNQSCAPGHQAAARLFALADSLVRRYYPRPLPRQGAEGR
jgi:hypothetical protein